MEHKMKLNNGPFNMMKNGQKDIEMRLYDEKRQQIKKGDTIEFTNITSGEIIKYVVKELHTYDSFEKIYQKFDKQRLGYEESEEAHYTDMEQYYSKSDIERYGVVGIELIKE